MAATTDSTDLVGVQNTDVFVIKKELIARWTARGVAVGSEQVRECCEGHERPGVKTGCEAHAGGCQCELMDDCDAEKQMTSPEVDALEITRTMSKGRNVIAAVRPFNLQGHHKRRCAKTRAEKVVSGAADVLVCSA